MPQRIPLRDRSLADMAAEWKIRESVLRQWLERGRLKAHVWVPLRSVFRHKGSGEVPKLCHWEGFAPLSRHYCFRLFRHGEIRLRDFYCQDLRHRFLLPHSAEDIIVKVDDLIILEKDKLSLEEQLSQTLRHDQHGANSCNIEIMPSFRRVRLGEYEHQFGTVQANALRLLYDAASCDEPWVNGKQLLQQAGSQSYTLSNLFKRKPVWRELIRSDGRGYYRLDEEVLQRITQASPLGGLPGFQPNIHPPPPY